MVSRATAMIAAAFALVLPPTAATGQTPQAPTPSPQAANGEATPSSATTAMAVRAAGAVSIDGRDLDPVWLTAARYTQFRQFEPKVDSEPSFRTEFRVSYDARNLYVFVRMFDPHPDSIMRALSRRDQRGPSDQIKLLIDSYNDKRSGYEFAVNPDGVKRDYSMSNDGNEDDSWNGIWDVATTVDSLGWTAEFRIPLSQMRYNKAASNTFGFGIWRDIERYRERVSWPLWSPKKAGLSSQLGEISGLVGLSTERRMEVTPYAVTKNVQRLNASSTYDRNQEMTVGGDVKLGITPNVTLDATVNPDFGQVESDPSVVNLTAFETFLGERRPFFVEGSGLYQFNLNCYIVVDCSTNEGLFYSRRIGRSPALRGLYGDNTTPTSTTIATAAKLTGRTPSGLSFAALDAITPRVDGVAAAPGAERRTVEPFTNFGLLRAQQDLRGGDMGISWIGTAVNRTMDQWTDPYMHGTAYATGATFRNRFSKRRYELSGMFAASRVTGTPEAIAATQTSSVHYYQQPGDKLTVDSSRTSLSGYSSQLKFGKYSGGITRFETSVIRTSPGFDVNDLGFLRRADYTDWSTWAALSWREARGIYRWAQLNGNHWETWNTSGARLQNALNFNGHMGLDNLGFLNNWDVHLGTTIDRLTESYCDRNCTRGGPPVRGSRGFYPWGGFNSDSRRVVSGGFWFNYWHTDEGKTTGHALSPYLSFRMSTQFSLSIGTDFSTDHNNTQHFGKFTDATAPFATHYSFAHLEQRTTSMNVRMNYTMTPDLTLELYAQPFTARGTFSDFRELSANPGAEKYDDRFQAFTPPSTAATTFKSTALITNSVVRWEYRPGSTLFLVWQHGRSGPDPLKDQFSQAWSRDFRQLFDLHPDNTFLIKAAYWLSR
ncbi:MAG TPA: DUF5916 domain-containing protein [Gemmatimonadaceae bacterium]|nr:DUF5916 domain-containing protein [Gemmatimonadaceae bacterium]